MWWNVGLLAGNNKAAADTKRFPVLEAIGDICRDLRYDLIGLCELSENDVAHLEALLEPIGFGVISFQDKVGKLKFDMCLLYRTSKLEPVPESRKVKVDSGRQRVNQKIGGSIILVVRESGDAFSVICSHWPSRMNSKHSGSYLRSWLGHALLDMYSEASAVTSYVILMGDYNDEPQDGSIFLEFGAGRDCGWALCNARPYNPFWRHLSGKYSPLSVAESTTHGSFLYRGQWPQQDWWLFDQMIFSPGFLGFNDWILDERSTGILPIEDVMLPKKSNSLSSIKLDHLPVCSRVIRK